MKLNLKCTSFSGCRLLLFAIAIMAFSACSKSGSGSSVSFTGTYAGSLKYLAYSETDTISIPASNSSAIVMNTKTGLGSSYSINGTVSGSNVTITSQTISVLGTTYTVTGNGTLTGSTLVINYVYVNSAKVSYDWQFTGTKQ